jgi:hypothetical protein
MDGLVSGGAASLDLRQPVGDADQAVEAGQGFAFGTARMYLGRRCSSTHRSTSGVMVPTTPKPRSPSG